MYFSKKNKFFHGVMFHHFHDNKKYKFSQGSITSNELYKVIKYIGQNNILNADEFIDKFKNKKLKTNNVCLTFDDGLKCQYELAVPVLEDLKIKSFFFIQSQPLVESGNLIEIFRYFRNNFFNSVDGFYDLFFKVINKNLTSFFYKHRKQIESVKKQITYYSENDIKFRFVRDILLTKKEYDNAMLSMFKIKKFQYRNYLKSFHMNSKQIKDLDKKGHLIGLHSHKHHHLIEKLNYNDQLKEYSQNFKILTNILNKSKQIVRSMSHPNGSYNKNTLKILENLNIEIGFKQTINLDKKMKKINNTPLEIARQDHGTILKMIENLKTL